MTDKRYVGLALGVTVLAVAGLTASVTSLFQSKPRKSPAAVTISEPNPKSRAEGKSVGQGVSAKELKELILRSHPGMDLTKEIEEAVEEAVDVTKLPLPERRQRIEQGLAAHLREAWDSGWGSATEDRLASDFAAVAEEMPFDLAKVECRTSTCVATLSWKDYDMAQAVYDTIVSTPIGLGCRLEMLPPDAGAREAVAFLDCAKQRARSAAAVPMVASITGAVPTTEGFAAAHSDPELDPTTH